MPENEKNIIFINMYSLSVFFIYICIIIYLYYLFELLDIYY